ncbi:hypothetical protein [Nonomuraea endophytica]|uniref:hypothetical protein n=1 Tax=Nonomuraea endophytica TaxID=714136 RepID=UPI0037C6B2B1
MLGNRDRLIQVLQCQARISGLSQVDRMRARVLIITSIVGSDGGIESKDRLTGVTEL